MKHIMLAQWELQKSLEHAREYQAPISRYSQLVIVVLTLALYQRYFLLQQVVRRD